MWHALHVFECVYVYNQSEWFLAQGVLKQVWRVSAHYKLVAEDRITMSETASGKKKWLVVLKRTRKCLLENP